MPVVLRRVALAAALLAVAYGAYRYRRVFIRSFFGAGAGGGAAPSLSRPRSPSAPLPPVARTRVVLIDGVDRATAQSLPSYGAVCDDGLDLIVDVGFPTVSLPVQRVLWTGLTQQQTGVLFALAELPPPAGGIPGQVPGSVGVADAHPEILASLGFADTVVPAADTPAADFQRAALAAVTSDAPLAFVHLLQVDAAGHHHGRASAEYRAAAADADALLGVLRAADAVDHRDDTRWFVLSDHGHRAGGGHGGAEPHIRRVRGCIAGALPASLPAAGGRAVHLVDVARALADSTGARLPDASAGRPLGEALAAPLVGDEALPSPGVTRWLVAALLLAFALAATAWAAGRRAAALPWWWPIAYAAVLALEHAPTLSVPMIYRPHGRTMYEAALPGLCVLAVLAALALRRLPPLRVAVAQLALPLAAAAAALALAGVGTGDPPLMPGWTARASLYLVLAFSGAVVVALAVLASAVRIGSGRTTPSETRGTGA